MKKFIFIILTITFLSIILIASYFFSDNPLNEIAIENINNNDSIKDNTISNITKENSIEASEDNKQDTHIEKPISNPVIEVNSSNFTTEVLQSDQPVLVDFYATWCYPCKYLSPILKELANETPNLKVVKIDVDKEETLSYQYRAFSLPTVILFKNGKEVNRFVGAAPKEEIIKFINQYI